MMTAANQDPARYSVAVIASALRSRMQGKCTLLECMASYEASCSPPADVARKRPSSEQIRHSDDGCMLPAFRHTMGVVQTAVWLGGACLGVLTGGGGGEDAPSYCDEGHQNTRLEVHRRYAHGSQISCTFKGRSLEHTMFQPGPLKCYSHD